MKTSVVIASFFAVAVSAHGKITSPVVRMPGQAMADTCGSDAKTAVEADDTGPVESVKFNDNPDCNPFLCRGAQYADNMANVQQLNEGDKVAFIADITIPHAGQMNVSVVNAKENKLIGDSLVFDENYADEKKNPLPESNTVFSVLIPKLEGKCAEAGNCVLQWYWVSKDGKQTYENCVDIVVAAPTKSTTEDPKDPKPTTKPKTKPVTKGFGTGTTSPTY